MSNIITIQLQEEDRLRLDMLYYRLGVLIERLPGAAAEATPAQEMTSPDAGHPVDEVSPHGDPEPVTEPEPVAPAPKWTKEDLQAKVQALAAPGLGKTAQVREIVKSYAERVGLIPEDKYDEVMAKLDALEQEG